MDAFFVAVEQRDNPKLRSKPVVVGSPKKRGVIAAASYEARKYGIHSAMPSVVAARKCPHLIFVPGRFQAYKEASNQIMQIFYEYTELVEPMSLDEAYLDVTSNKVNNPSATLIAKEIKRRIKESTELTASAGVSYNKFLAKIASDYDKPDGLFVITPEMAEKFIESLDIEKFPGVGKATAVKMHEQDIRNGKDLKKLSKFQLLHDFGKFGEYLYNMARGIDNREVISERIRKSIGAERTFLEDVFRKDEIIKAVERISDILVKRIKKSDSSGRTVTLKIKYFDFEITTRSKTLPHYISEFEEILAIAHELLYTPIFPQKRIRLIGLSLSSLDNDEKTFGEQLKLDFKNDTTLIRAND